MALASFLDVPIAANSERVVAVTGDWVACLAATADFRLGVDQESAAHFEAGLYWRPARRFSQVRLGNDSGVANVVSILVGDGVFEDRRAIAAGGGAEGIDPATIADVRAYAFRGQRTCSPAAGETGHLQIYNPAASGVVAACRGLYLHSNVAGQIALFPYATALSSSLSAAPRSAYFGDPDGALQWRQQNQVAQITVASGTNLAVVRVQANGFVHLPFQSPLLIPEGWGLVARHNELGPLDFDFGFDLLELPA